jgi:hypothetical protein
MDSCHGGIKGNGGKVRTWGEARKGERRAGTSRATRKIGKKEKKSKENRKKLRGRHRDGVEGDDR